MRIAIIADPIDNQKGGVHVYTRELVRHLLQAGGGHEWILIRERKDPSLSGARQIVIPNIRIGLGLAALRLFFVVPLVLWWHKVDVVFEPAHFGPFNLPARIRRVTMIHDMTPLLFPQYHRFHSQWLQRIFLRGILRRASLILANSAHTAADIRTFFPEVASRITTIPLGCDPDMQPNADMTWLEQSGIRLPYWLSVGTIEPRKNLVRLLEAYAAYRMAEKEGLPLLVVGQQGWKSESFYRALDEHPYRADIHLAGFVPNSVLSALYTHARALVYPSEYEGFGLPVLEALSCGCPVICSGVSSLPEVGGDTAWYVDPMDTQALTRAMLQMGQLPADDYKRLQQEGRQRAALFNWTDHARDWLDAVGRIERGMPDPEPESPSASRPSGHDKVRNMPV